MSRGKLVLMLSVVGLGIVLAVGQAMSQDATQNNGGGGRRGGGPNAGGPGGPGGPGAFRQQMADRIKTALGATDDEWKVLQPKVEKITTLNMDLRRGAMQGMGGRGGRNRGQGGADQAQTTGTADQQPQPTALQKAQTALQTVLDNKDSKPADIKTALSSYRDARAKVRADLEKAQKDLRDALTARQEAQMVMMNILE
jgi:hypothetical protein